MASPSATSNEDSPLTRRSSFVAPFRVLARYNPKSYFQRHPLRTMHEG